MLRNAPSARRTPGFTLIEMIVVLLILAALAAIGTVAFQHITQRAQIAADEAQMRNIGMAVLSTYTAEGNTGPLTRQMVAEALESSFAVPVNDGQSASDSWNLLDPTQTPDGPEDFSIAFDDGVEGPAVNGEAGTRVLIAAATKVTDRKTTAALVSTGPHVQHGSGIVTCVSPQRAPAGDLLANLDSQTSCSDAADALPAKATPATNVVATAGDRSVDVAWAAARNATSYLVRVTAEGRDDVICETGSTACAVTGLTNNTQYTVVVSAISEIATLTSDAVTAIPRAPGIQASPTVAVAGVTHSAATLTWAAPEHAETYDVQWRVAGGTWTTAEGLTERTYTVTPDQQSSKVEVRVRASNAAGPGPWSAVVTAQLTTPVPTTAPNVTVGTITHTTAALSWQAVTNALTYELQWRVSGGTWAQVDNLTKLVFTLNPSQQSAKVEARVRAASDSGPGPWSAVVTAQLTTPIPTGTPVVTVSNVTHTTALFSWTAVSGATSYDMRWRTNGTAWNATASTTGRTMTLGPTSQGTFLEFQTRAVNAGGAGPWSAQGSAQLTVAGPTWSGWVTSTSYPTLNARITGVTCPAGTLVQSQYRDKVTNSPTWGGWRAWTTQDSYGAATSTTAATVSEIGAYGVGADIEVGVRCYNPASGQASATAGPFPNQLWHPMPAPSHTYAGLPAYRTVDWGGTCPADTVWRGNWWVAAATFQTGQNWVEPGRWSHTSVAWGSGTISAVGVCHHPARGNGPEASAWNSF